MVMVAYIKEVSGRHIGDGVFYTEQEAAALIGQGVAMLATDYRQMLEDRKERAKEMRHIREDKADAKEAKADAKEAREVRLAKADAKEDKADAKEAKEVKEVKKAPEAPKKDKMIHAPMKKKAEGKSKSEPSEPVMRWRK